MSTTQDMFNAVWNKPNPPIDEGKSYLVKFFNGTGQCTFTKERVAGIDVLALINLANRWQEQIFYYEYGTRTCN